MENTMFRYLEKYVGTYRVLAHYDEFKNDFPRDKQGQLDNSFDDLYIPCVKASGEIRHTYKEGMLAYYCPKITVARNLVKIIESKKNPIEITFEDCGEEALIYFKESDLAYFAKLVSAKTNGKNISPYSKRNLQKKDSKVQEDLISIPEKEMNRYSSLLSAIPKNKKMIFAKFIINDFMEQLLKNKALKEQKEELDLDSKSFIYYTGNWNKFIKFASDRARKEYGTSV